MAGQLDAGYAKSKTSGGSRFVLSKTYYKKLKPCAPRMTFAVSATRFLAKLRFCLRAVCNDLKYFCDTDVSNLFCWPPEIHLNTSIDNGFADYVLRSAIIDMALGATQASSRLYMVSGAPGSLEGPESPGSQESPGSVESPESLESPGNLGSAEGPGS